MQARRHARITANPRRATGSVAKRRPAVAFCKTRRSGWERLSPPSGVHSARPRGPRANGSSRGLAPRSAGRSSCRRSRGRRRVPRARPSSGASSTPLGFAGTEYQDLLGTAQARDHGVVVDVVQSRQPSLLTVVCLDELRLEGSRGPDAVRSSELLVDSRDDEARRFPLAVTATTNAFR